MIKKKNLIISISLVSLLIASAFAFSIFQTGTLTNMFSIGKSGVQLIETFDGKTYEGSIGESDDSFANAVMSPGKTYEKIPTVKSNGDGKAFAYLKITVPNDTSSNVVNEFGVKSSAPVRIVTPNFNEEAITANQSTPDKWFKISEESVNNATEYIFVYTTKLDKGDTTHNSPLSSVTIANLFINNNDFSDLSEEYTVPVTAYTVHLSANDTMTAVEAWSHIS